MNQVDKFGRRSTPSESMGTSGERLVVTSGRVLLIDQFMLANEQFVHPMLEICSKETGEENDLKALVSKYGGCIASFAPGRYRILRDPDKQMIAFYPDFEGNAEEFFRREMELGEHLLYSARDEDPESKVGLGKVFVDTRCIAFADFELLGRSGLVDSYLNLRRSRGEKTARDFLREQGAAVRYGFNRYGDELSVFEVVGSDKTVALWPTTLR